MALFMEASDQFLVPRWRKIVRVVSTFVIAKEIRRSTARVKSSRDLTKVRFWHLADIQPAPTNVRYQG